MITGRGGAYYLNKLATNIAKVRCDRLPVVHSANFVKLIFVVVIRKMFSVRLLCSVCPLPAVPGGNIPPLLPPLSYATATIKAQTALTVIIFLITDIKWWVTSFSQRCDAITSNYHHHLHIIAVNLIIVANPGTSSILAWQHWGTSSMIDYTAQVWNRWRRKMKGPAIGWATFTWKMSGIKMVWVPPHNK